MGHAAAIDSLLAGIPRLWRGREPNRHQRALSTGHGRLDMHLPGGGWPVGAVTELVTSQPGLGEFSLLFPALAEISHNGHWLILVDPPWVPYPAALQGHGLALERLLLVRTDSARESLWACEQALHGIQGGAVLAWPEHVSFARLRRLQLAAEANAKLAFLFRPEQALTSASPCALRLRLQGAAQGNAQDSARGNTWGTRIDLIKCRGKCRSTLSSESVWIPHRHVHMHPTPGCSLQRQSTEAIN
jgi:hypothetical protein